MKASLRDCHDASALSFSWFSLAPWQDLLHGCYEKVTLCAVHDGCLLPRLPGVLVPFAFNLEMKVETTSSWSVSSCVPHNNCMSSKLILRHLLMII